LATSPPARLDPLCPDPCHAFEVPAVAGVKFHDMAVVSLGGIGTISHIINNTGAAANPANNNSYLVDFP
jgi:hypothetical protein